MDSNEIRTEGGLALVEALKNKKNLKTLCLLGNEFGEKGRLAIKGIADEFNLGDALEWPRYVLYFSKFPTILMID